MPKVKVRIGSQRSVKGTFRVHLLHTHRRRKVLTTGVGGGGGGQGSEYWGAKGGHTFRLL